MRRKMLLDTLKNGRFLFEYSVCKHVYSCMDIKITDFNKYLFINRI